MYRYKLVVQYRGTNFLGFQRQSEESEIAIKKFSIQTVLEKALRAFQGNRCSPTVTISGRTDAGVHALANHAHVDLKFQDKAENLLPPNSADSIKNGINHHLSLLTSEIYISKVERVDESFHARYSALERRYIYKIVNSPDLTNRPFEYDLRWYVHNPLDVELMKTACAMFVGTHNFSCFLPSAAKKTASPIRTIDRCYVDIESPQYPITHSDQTLINIITIARSFFMHQVRNMVSVITAVGKGQINLQNLRHMLESGEKPVQKMAPARGLYFLDVKYPEYKVLDSSLSWRLNSDRDIHQNQEKSQTINEEPKD
eukprot:TRINITY_DN11851_c0_g1_i1.p1 TRINITY_DN11851_c0_g1~~TRINITY_DN11851_c0_g1_i1.p1  ORF type:complete len:314 (+),score=46.82 TRINITY_DN11851_c0_g1_i1:38-979(+)